MALLFGPADYFSLMVLGLMFAVVLARGSVLKALAMIVFGILLSTVGTDLETGEERLTFGWSEISDGIDFAVIAMGMFGFAEIIKNLENPETRDVVKMKVGRLLPSLAEIQAVVRADHARHVHRLVPRPVAGQRRGARPVRLLHGRKEARQGPEPLRQGRHRRRRRARSPPTTPARRPRSFRC